jgi:hypothetical protein
VTTEGGELSIKLAATCLSCGLGDGLKIDCGAGALSRFTYGFFGHRPFIAEVRMAQLMRVAKSLSALLV